jgi:hypothetical protein
MKTKTREKEKKTREYSKVLVTIITANAIAWIWCSYLLAAMDKVQIAEDLSKTALVTIIGTVVPYLVKSVFENLSKNNSWPDVLKDDTEYTQGDQDQEGERV